MRRLPLALSAIAALFALGAAQARTVQQQVAASPHGEVDVSNVAGQIEITGWDKPQVAVSADLGNDSQHLEVRSDTGRTSIQIRRDFVHWSSLGGARLEVHVPRGSEINVSGVSAEIRSRGVIGAQHLQSVSGGIDAELGSGNNEVKSVSGTIRLQGGGGRGGGSGSGSGSGFGSLHVTSVSGEVSVKNVAGDLEARTISGRLDAQLASTRSVRLHTTSGEIELTARLDRGGTIEAGTVSGSARIAATAAAGFQYEAQTFSGDLDDCFGQRAERTGEYGPGRRLDGTRGAGDARVRITSLSGDISLCDH
ncbi:MAG: DUF4097 family beta strand repeat-containing protein [Steroidobacteraceae bacterium]